MTKREAVSVFKPTLAEAAREFATGSPQKPSEAISDTRQGVGSIKIEKAARKVSGLVPKGDVRLTANVSEKHHSKLKVSAAKLNMTIGELIERLVDKLDE